MYNYAGRYKALCRDEVVLINDYFLVDFDSNMSIGYGAIKDTVKENNAIIVQSNEKTQTLKFENPKDTDAFFEALKRKQ